MDEPTLGCRITIARYAKGFTVDELAKRAKVHPLTLSKIESDITKNPNLATLRRIAWELATTVGKLVDGTRRF